MLGISQNVTRNRIILPSVEAKIKDDRNAKDFKIINDELEHTEQKKRNQFEDLDSVKTLFKYYEDFSFIYCHILKCTAVE